MSKGWASFWILVLIVPSSAWAAFVASRIWLWFAVPLGAPRIGVAHMMGLALIVSMYRYTGPENSGGKDTDDGADLFGKFIARAFFVPLFGLGLAYLYTLFL